MKNSIRLNLAQVTSNGIFGALTGFAWHRGLHASALGVFVFLVMNGIDRLLNKLVLVEKERKEQGHKLGRLFF